MEIDTQTQQQPQITQPVQPSAPSPLNPSNNIKKMWIIIAVVLALIGMGAGGYLLGTNKSQSTQSIGLKQNEGIITTNPTSTQENNLNTNAVSKVAFIRDSNLWVSVNGAEKQITNDAKYTQSGVYTYPTVYYSYPSISPDHNKIIFFKTVIPTGGSSTTSLYIVNVDGSGFKSLIANGDFERTYPVQWLNDNQNILIETYKVHAGDNTTLVKLNILNGTQQQLTSYNIQSGCGGSSSDPSLGLAGSEGARPVYSKIFQLSSDNNYLIHNTACTGYGVNIYNLQTNQDKPLSDNITQAIFSPDGTKVAGIGRNNQILLFDVKTASPIKTITATLQPEVLYWSQDGQIIYYGADTLVKNLTAKDDLGNSLEGNQNQSSLWSISVDGTNNKKLHDFDAYDIKPLFFGNNKVVVSVVDNPTKYFDALSQGNTTNLSNFSPTVNIVTVDLSSGAVESTIQKVSQSIYSSK